MSELATKQAETSTFPRPRVVEDSAHPLAALRTTLTEECAAMLYYALDQDKAIPPEVNTQVSTALGPTAAGDEATALNTVMLLHGQLSSVIAPANGRTLVLFEEERRTHPKLYVFGPVRVVRQLLAFAVIALLLTGVLSTTTEVDVKNVAAGWFDLNGLEAYAVLAFLFSIASLGSVFSNLAIISRYIEDASYDPIFEGSYWVRVILGLISGVVLGEILFDLVAQANPASALVPASERIVMTFLGGFATAPVQKLLGNLSDAIGTLLQGRDYKQAPPPPRNTTITVVPPS